MLIQCPKNQSSPLPRSFHDRAVPGITLEGDSSADLDLETNEEEAEHFLWAGAHRMHMESLDAPLPSSLDTPELGGESNFSWELIGFLFWVLAIIAFILLVPRNTAHEAPIPGSGEGSSAHAALDAPPQDILNTRVTTRDERGEAPVHTNDRARALLLFYYMMKNSKAS